MYYALLIISVDIKVIQYIRQIIAENEKLNISIVNKSDNDGKDCGLHYSRHNISLLKEQNTFRDQLAHGILSLFLIKCFISWISK